MAKHLVTKPILDPTGVTMLEHPAPTTITTAELLTLVVEFAQLDSHISILTDEDGIMIYNRHASTLLEIHNDAPQSD